MRRPLTICKAMPTSRVGDPPLARAGVHVLRVAHPSTRPAVVYDFYRCLFLRQMCRMACDMHLAERHAQDRNVRLAHRLRTDAAIRDGCRGRFRAMASPPARTALPRSIRNELGVGGATERSPLKTPPFIRGAAAVAAPLSLSDQNSAHVAEQVREMTVKARRGRAVDYPMVPRQR